MTIFDHTLISFQLSKLKLERYCSVIQMVTQHLWIILLAHYVYVQCIRSLCYGLCTNNHGTFWFKKMQIILAKTLFGSIALLSHNTLKWSVIFGLSFFAWCWWPREFVQQGSSMLSEFCTSLSKVLTLWHCVKVKQRYLCAPFT